MLYELRIYYANPGRLPEVRARFENHAMRMFPRYGIKVVDYFAPADDREAVYYICEFSDMAARNKAWDDFTKNPEWQEIRTKSHANGVLVKETVSHFMEKLPLPK